MPSGSAMVAGEDDDDDEVALIVVGAERILRGRRSFWGLKEEGHERNNEGWIDDGAMELWGLKEEMMKLLSLQEKAIVGFFSEALSLCLWQRVRTHWHCVMTDVCWGDDSLSLSLSL